MIQIEIKNTNVVSETRKGYHFRKQTGWASTFDKSGKPLDYPERIEVSLDAGDPASGTEDQPPYPAGVYALSPASYYVGQYGQLLLGRLRLLPRKV